MYGLVSLRKFSRHVAANTSDLEHCPHPTQGSMTLLYLAVLGACLESNINRMFCECMLLCMFLLPLIVECHPSVHTTVSVYLLNLCTAVLLAYLLFYWGARSLCSPGGP